MSASSYTFQIEVPRQIRWMLQLDDGAGLRSFTREDFYAFLWERFGSEHYADGAGLVGVHEGTLLSEEAFASGAETESWTIDSGEAPRERDWVESQENEKAVLYFGSQKAAYESRETIRKAAGLVCGEIEEQKPQDWDAAWKASFQGVAVPPYWEILPPWKERPEKPTSKVIRLNPGAGFGTGTHETTQLCLMALAHAIGRGETGGERTDPPLRVLDFGSGSGILSIAAGLLGADVDGIEIDPLAIDNATENLSLNSVPGRVRFGKTFEELGLDDPATPKYPVVVANILRPVLIEFAEKLTGRLARPGKIVLSGLVSNDIPEVIVKYSSLLGGGAPQIFERGDWRAVLFEAP
jgi:ribosomal protein L11 methyltransferase